MLTKDWLIRNDLWAPALPEVKSFYLSLPTFHSLFGRSVEQGRAVIGHHDNDLIRGSDLILRPSKIGMITQQA